MITVYAWLPLVIIAFGILGIIVSWATGLFKKGTTTEMEFALFSCWLAIIVGFFLLVSPNVILK